MEPRAQRLIHVPVICYPDFVLVFVENLKSEPLWKLRQAGPLKYAFGFLEVEAWSSKYKPFIIPNQKYFYDKAMKEGFKVYFSMINADEILRGKIMIGLKAYKCQRC